MTLICDFCKKPLKALDNKPLTLGETTLDFHPECNPKWIDRIVNGAPPPATPPPPPPQPSPPVQQFLNERPPRKVKRSFWSGKPKESKAQTEEELAGAFG